jgi:uncharacterized protein (TIGR02145 family)
LALPATVLANAGPDQFSLTGLANLTANTPGAGQTGTWTITTGSGATFSDVNDPSATFTVGTDSSYTLVWTISSPCGTSQDTVSLLFPVNSCKQAAVTYAGEIYPTVQIGTQCWFAKNLNVGTMIQGGSDQTNNQVIEKYCAWEDSLNSGSGCGLYGGLYQWGEAVQYQNGASDTTSPNPAFTGNVRGICPTGWHLPSDAEWGTLETFLGGTSVAGGALKSTSGWLFSGAGTNSSGFSAPAGGSFDVGLRRYFDELGSAYFWSSSESSRTNTISRFLSWANSEIWRYNFYKSNGFSVRCTQD